MMSLEIFGFRALWSPYFFLGIVIITVGYFLLTVKYRHLFNGSEPLTKFQGTLFSFTMLLLYFIKGGPVDLMGHLMFYAHMIQMAILLFIIPPLLIVSIPDWVWMNLRQRPIFKRAFNFLTKPLFAIIFFNTLFSLYHVPAVFDVIKTSMFLHEFYTGLLMLFSLLMWWPLVNRIEEYHSITGLKKVAYIFVGSALILPACALIIFNSTPMYATYTNPELWAKSLELCVPSSTLALLDLSGPEMFSSMSALHDQQLGGVLMKVIQELVYGYMLSRAFFEWYKKDQQEPIQESISVYNPQSAK
jgi:putative membrane protein